MSLNSKIIFFNSLIVISIVLGSPPLSPVKDELIDCNNHQISRLLDNNISETNDCNNKELISIHVISDLKNQTISSNQHKRNHSLEENCVTFEDHDNENI